MSLTVVSDEDLSLSDIKYEQIAFEKFNFQMSCPDIGDYESNSGNMKLKWYKV